ncbi:MULTISPECIES: NAD(P)H-dependent flavin oxidoreductase [unclassified Lysinibacillus]|uniref:NAD(P)H-dependent flavin oxidoreductase n=1 Tax=unclassified Lysinibacillus TaxID=2636778 RepID=UPI00382D0555
MSRLPIIVAPMFLISNPAMVIEASRAGAIGSFPLLNARPASTCAEWLQEIKEALPTEPWAVNFICHPVANARFEEDLQLIEEYEPPIVITSLGNPKRVIDIVHSYGGKVYADVANVKHAEKSAATGVDGLILVCAGAGGHGGQLNPFGFVSAVKKFFNGTIILSGAISSGADVLAAQIIGADYAYLGTRFIACHEGNAPDDYKKMVIDSKTDDVLYTDAFSGVHVNVLIPSLLKEGIDPSSLKPREDIDLTHLVNVKAWRDIWSAGHGVTNIEKRESVLEIITTLHEEYESAKQQLNAVQSL